MAVPPLLEGPFDILELKDGDSLKLHPDRWLLGSMVIAPKYPGAPPAKTIRVLRLWPMAGEKPMGMPYWDITSQTLIAQLTPLLPGVKVQGSMLRITAHGTAPSKRFTVEVLA